MGGPSEDALTCTGLVSCWSWTDENALLYRVKSAINLEFVGEV
jgi:hypothetical protein